MVNKGNGFNGKKTTKGNKEPYSLRFSFTMSFMQTYSLLLVLTTTLCDRAFVEPFVFQPNHMTRIHKILSFKLLYKSHTHTW